MLVTLLNVSEFSENIAGYYSLYVFKERPAAFQLPEQSQSA